MAGAFARVDPIGNDDAEAVLCTTTNGATHAPQGAIGEALLRRSASAARTPVAQLGRELARMMTMSNKCHERTLAAKAAIASALCEQATAFIDPGFHPISGLQSVS
jgi:hypothetical protein